MPRPAPMTALCALLLGSGCGPIQATAAMMDADVALASARTAGAQEKSPYELTAAELYLQKAREEVGYSEFEVAVELAKKATRHAQEARERALKSGTASPSPTPAPTPAPPPGPGPAPAAPVKR